MSAQTSIDNSNAAVGYSAVAMQRAAQQFKTLVESYKFKPVDVFLNDLVDRIVRANQLRDLQRIRIWKRNRDFYTGGQIGDWDKHTGAWVPITPKPEDHAYPVNMYGYFVRSVQSLWTRSNTKYLIKPRYDDPMIVGASRIASVVTDDWYSRRWRATERQIEAKNAQLTGNYLRHLWWAEKADVPAFRPKVEQLEIAGEDEGFHCYECGMEGPVDGEAGGSMMASQATRGGFAPEMDQSMTGDAFCPHCGSQNVERYGLPPMTMDIVTGQEQFDGGDVFGEPVDPIECRMHDRAYRFELSPFFTRTRLFLVETLQKYFPHMQIPFATPTDIRLLYQSAIESNVGGFYNDLGSSLEGLGALEEVWISPELYSWYVTPPKDSQGNEFQMEPDTPFAALYPNGFYLARIGGKLTGLPRKENKADWWAHGRFDIVPGSVWGRGQDDAVTENEALNYAENLWFDILMTHAARMTAYNPLKFNPEDITGSPEDLLELQNALQDDENPGQFIWQSQPAGATPDLPAFIEKKYRNMQGMFAAFAALQGDSEGRSETATRTAILRDQATMQHGSALELKAECDVATTERMLRIYQRNWQGVRFYYTKGQYDDYEGQYFERADIQGDFQIEAVPGSWNPRSEGEKRAAIIEAANLGGVPGGVFNPEVFSPKMRRVLLEDFGISYDIDDVAPDYRKQRLEIKRLEDMLEDAIATFEQMGIPEMLPPGTPLLDGTVAEDWYPNPMIVSFLAKKIPVERMKLPGMGDLLPAPSIDNDEVHIACVGEWLLSDKGLAARPVLRHALMAHAREHYQCMVATEQFKAGGMLAAQAPLKAAADADEERRLARESESKGEGSGADKGKKTAPPSEANMEKSSEQLESRLPMA